MLAIGLGILLMRGQRYTDFWMVAQLILWPWIVALAGIVADVVIHAGRRGATVPRLASAFETSLGSEPNDMTPRRLTTESN